MVMDKGALLGHSAGRGGYLTDPERIQAIVWDSVPLTDLAQVRQCAGSTNGVRRYLFLPYAHAVGKLGDYMKPGAIFPGLGF